MYGRCRGCRAISVSLTSALTLPTFDEMNGNHERIFIALATLLFNPWIAGIILSAILAAVMSTLSCQLLVCSSAITEDFYKGFLRKNAQQAELVWIGRVMVLAIAVISILIASDPNSKVLGLVAYAWAGFGAAFGPVLSCLYCGNALLPTAHSPA